LRGALALTLLAVAGAAGAALWAEDQEQRAAHDHLEAQSTADRTANRHVRLNLPNAAQPDGLADPQDRAGEPASQPRPIPASPASSNQMTTSPTPADPADAPAPALSAPAATQDASPAPQETAPQNDAPTLDQTTGQDQPAAGPADEPVAAPTNDSAPDVAPDSKAENSSDATMAPQQSAETTQTDAAPVQTAPAPLVTPIEPPKAPHIIHLIVTDRDGDIDGLVKLPKGLTLVTSATNPQMQDYIGFASHLGHKVLLAFPVSDDASNPALMHPNLSDDENLARLDRLLTDNTLLAGVKLYWNNPLAGRADLMTAAFKMVADKGLILVGSNGPLEDRETDWATQNDQTLIKASIAADKASDIKLPRWGELDVPQRHIMATAITPDRQAIKKWAAIARWKGWTLSPLPSSIPK